MYRAQPIQRQVCSAHMRLLKRIPHALSEEQRNTHIPSIPATPGDKWPGIAGSMVLSEWRAYLPLGHVTQNLYWREK